MKKASYTMPTSEELYAFEKRAREERARFVAAQLRSAGRALKSFIARVFATRSGKVLGKVRHA